MSMSYTTRYHIPAKACIGALAALLIAGCSDSPTDNDAQAPEAAINFQRLFVADAQNSTGRLLALHNDSVVATFTFPTTVSAAVTSGSGRHVMLRMSGQNTHFVDGGVWIDNGFARTAPSGVLPFKLEGGNPSHDNVNGDWMSVHFDGSGHAVWVRESQLRTASSGVAFESNPGQPFHGGSITVLANGAPFFVHSMPNSAGAAQGVIVRNQQGQTVAEIPIGGCPGLHGNGAVLSGGVFGCNDGMVWVRPNGSSVTAEKVTMTGDMQGLALRNSYQTSGVDFMLGQFAAVAGQPAQRVLAKLDPQTRSITRLPALPAGVVDHFRVIEPKQGRIVLLGTDGTLYIYSSSATLLRTVPGVVAALPTTGAIPHQVAAAENLVAVSSPSTGQVVLVDLNTGSVIRRVTVGGSPSRLAMVGARQAGEYTPAD
jgi:hypothetical protein